MSKNGVEISMVLKKSQTLKNGEHPILMKVYWKGMRKNKRYATGLTCSVSKWDHELGRYKRNKEGNDTLSELESKAKKTVNLVINSNADFSLGVFDNIHRKKFSEMSLQDFWKSETIRLEKENRYGTASSYLDSLKAFEKFVGNKPVQMSSINLKLFQDFEKHLISNKMSVNGRGNYLRSFCAVIGYAIKNGILPLERDFRHRISIKRQDTPKKAFTKEQMLLYINSRESFSIGSRIRLSVDLFVFSYISQGMNLKDIAELRESNIHNNRIYYGRSKTGDQLSINLSELHVNLWLSYARNTHDSLRKDDPYIFPIYGKFSENLDEKKLKLLRNTRSKAINRDIRKLALMFQIVNLSENETKQFFRYYHNKGKLPRTCPKKLEYISFYSARHTYATVLKTSGVDVSIISQALGHSNEKITQVYLKAFGDNVIDDANKNLF
jgi:integrase/recombinase XerD